MKKVLLVYLPFCTPASPPYSLVNLHSFLSHNCKDSIEVLDLNAKYHALEFPAYQDFFKDAGKWKDYEDTAKGYMAITTKNYAQNNLKIRKRGKPDHFDALLKSIKDKKPDIVAFSIVYSSQAFYASAIIDALEDVETIVGGPAVNHALITKATHYLKNEVELLEFLKGKKMNPQELNLDFSLDFSCLSLNEYFIPMPVIPIKTSSTCYHKKCTFCAHYSKVPYVEYPIGLIEKTIKDSGQKHFFLIDDMIPVPRLLELASMLRPLSVKWGCQLRPTKEFTSNVLSTLRESGLEFVIWGVESGVDRILKLMKKGTNTADVEKVLNDSHDAGIKNVTYIMFGFPTETKEEFRQTIEFLKRNDRAIDLISPSTFGLQAGTPAFENPSEFGITRITEHPRELLGPKIEYELSSGLTHEEAKEMRDKFKRSINNINKYPKAMNFFREHMFFA